VMPAYWWLVLGASLPALIGCFLLLAAAFS
jgi:hypothetical protein